MDVLRNGWHPQKKEGEMQFDLLLFEAYQANICHTGRSLRGEVVRLYSPSQLHNQDYATIPSFHN